MAEIINTGERILLEKETPLMIARHFCAYKFAGDFVRGKEVLDIGCGDGSVTQKMQKILNLKTIHGLDINRRLLKMAQNKI